MQLYYPELSFTIGEVFPIENPYENNAEGPLLVTHSEGVNLILYSDHIETDLPVWGSRTLVVGLTDVDNIPFVTVTFPSCDVALMYTLNIFGVIGDERSVWLRPSGSDLGVLLVDNKTGRLTVTRMIETTLLHRLKQVCYRQWKEYAGAEEVETRVQRLLNPPADEAMPAMTPLRAMKRAELSNQVVIQYPTAKPYTEQ